MSKSLSNPQLNDPHWEPKFPFDLVVAYEDRQTRSRALHLYDHLAQQLLDDYDFKCAWWKFDHLADIALREHAADDAADANMIVLSLRAEKEIPAACKAWIEAWLPRRDHRKSALVALIAGDEKADTSRLVTYLQSVARLGHLDLFTHFFGLNEPPGSLSIAAVQERASTMTPVLDEILQRQIPAPRWGINE
jgi:hypothetical protein